MNQPSDNQIVVDLKSKLWQLRLQPEMGMQTVLCKIQHADNWYNLMPDCTTTDAPLSACNFHMLPYSNRIRDAKFIHDGTVVELEHPAEHAIHGALRKRPWRITAQSSNSVTAEYDTQSDGAVNWPWPIHAKINYSLTDDSLFSEISLTNMGSTSMPAGMGWHPYFCREIAGAAPRLTIPVTGVYPDTNGNCLPTGPAIALPEALDFTRAQDLNPDQRIDHCLAGFSSPATIAWPDAGITLAMRASDNCKHAVLFNPDKPFFALEPVTNANDGFNLDAAGLDAGVVELQPGETQTATMTLQLTS